MKLPLLASVLATVALVSATAAAERSDLGARPVRLRIDAAGVPWTIKGIGSGTGSSTLEVPPGTYDVRIGDVRERLEIDRPSTIRHRPPAPALRAVGAGAFFTGIFVAGASLLAASGLCDSTTTDVFGRTTTRSCPRWDEPTSRAFIIAAGVGLTLTVAGGIVFFASGESVRVRDLDASTASQRTRSPARVTITPWLSGRDGGGAVTLAF